MTAILGISAYYHDSAAALVVDGEIVAAAQEERFSREKHDHRFPQQAIDYCLEEAGLRPEELDLVGFYDKPILKFERLLETYLAFAPVGFSSFRRAMPLWLKEKLHLPREMRRGLRDGYSRRFVFPEHHESHAASAFFPSPFEEAAILTLDGVGEWATATFGQGRGNRIELTHELRFPHSLGLLYSAFTYFCGFRVNSGEYKLMGLAPYGEPRFVDRILHRLMDLKEDGSFRLDLSYFNYCQGLTMTSRKMNRLLEGPPRQPESPLGQREMDLARSIQEVTEEVMLRSARHVHEQTGARNLCLAGGVALNCVGNGRILREGPFERVWIQPAAGDAGGALGVALLIWYQLLDNPRTPEAADSMQGARLGPSFGAGRIEEALSATGATYEALDGPASVCRRTAELLDEGRVVGWFQGAMEFGPRALGGRSILGDPRRPEMQRRMNLKIKFRESFRPFAPSVLTERSEDYFALGAESPYMLLVGPVSEERLRELSPEERDATGVDRLRVLRSEIPAVTHVDRSARVQTVDPGRNPLYHRLLRAWEERTGCGVLINTSFNVRGEPIVCTPEEALRCFRATGMDALVLGRFVLVAEEQPEGFRIAPEEHLERFELD
ncbi:MAG: carbamoyltransferase [Thermoanaerobaculia bacterium]|nr:carbamoyltransferase [Thermoanaerobaculia bacterium]